MHTNALGRAMPAFFRSYISIENIVLLFLFVYLEERLMEFEGGVVLVVGLEPIHSPVEKSLSFP